MVVILVAGLIFVALPPIVFLRTQDNDRSVEKREDFNPPVKIIAIKSRIGAIESNKQFSADEDWFKGLRIKLQNNGTEAVTYIEVRLRFPRSKEQKEKGELDLLLHLHYGVQSSLVSNGRVPPIAKGQEVDVELSDDVYHGIRNNPAFPTRLKKIQISVSMLQFIDGTVWIAGKRYKQNENEPGKLTPVPEASPTSPQPLSTVRAPPHGIGLQMQAIAYREMAYTPIQEVPPCRTTVSYNNVDCSPGSGCHVRNENVGGDAAYTGLQRETDEVYCTTTTPSGYEALCGGASRIVNVADFCWAPTPTPTPTPLARDYAVSKAVRAYPAS